MWLVATLLHTTAFNSKYKMVFALILLEKSTFPAQPCPCFKILSLNKKLYAILNQMILLCWQFFLLPLEIAQCTMEKNKTFCLLCLQLLCFWYFFIMEICCRKSMMLFCGSCFSHLLQVNICYLLPLTAFSSKTATGCNSIPWLIRHDRLKTSRDSLVNS